MLTALIVALIYICIAALVVYLVLWVLASIGIGIPAMVIKIIWIIFTLIVILWLVQALPLGRFPTALR